MGIEDTGRKRIWTTIVNYTWTYIILIKDPFFLRSENNYQHIFFSNRLLIRNQILIRSKWNYVTSMRNINIQQVNYVYSNHMSDEWDIEQQQVQQHKIRWLSKSCLGNMLITSKILGDRVNKWKLIVCYNSLIIL